MPARVEPEPVRPRRRRWRRRAAWAAGLLIVLVLGGWWLGRTVVIRALVLRDLAALTGGEVTAARVRLHADGRVVIEKSEVRAPGVSGVGGVVFSAERVEADVDWGSVLRGSPRLTSVLLVSPVARLSQSTRDGSLAAAALSPTSSPTGRLSIPTVVVRSGTVELGEHDGQGGYRMLRQVPVAGEVARAEDQSGGMIIAFSELGADGLPVAGPGGLQLTGAITDDEVRISLGVVSLSSWDADSMPGAFRETFRALAMEGHVFGGTLRYGFDGRVEASAALRGVALTLPVGVKPGEDADGRDVPVRPEDSEKRLRLEQVNGTLSFTTEGLRASLSGLMEGLPYDVTLTTEGNTPDAPFVCTIRCVDLHVAQKPEILKFAPGLVRRRLEQFSDPTGTIDVAVTISRARSAAPDEFSVNGSLRLRNTTAAFERFPYRFHNMRGEVEFDDRRIVIKSIEGEAPGGATLHATGLIESLTEEAAVTVDVTAKNVPIDGVLREAMGPRGWILDELFSREAHERLVREGLLDASAPLPGGTVDVRAQVRREPGHGNIWHDRVTIAVPEARVLAPDLPVPLVARGVTIIKDDQEATVSGGTIEIVGGGTLTLEVRADVSRINQPDAPLRPTAHVEARGVVLTPALLAAAPAQVSLGEVSLHEFLRRLNPRGSMDATITMGADPVGWRVRATATDLAASPASEDGAEHVSISGVRAAIDADAGGIDVEVAGLLGPAGAEPGASATLRVRRRTGEGGGVLELHAGAAGLDLRTPVEEVVALVSPDSGRTIREARRTYDPRGRAGLRVDVRRAPGEARPAVSVRVAELAGVSAVLDGHRVSLESSTGAIEAARAGDDAWRVSFAEFEAGLAVDGEADGTLRASGSCRIDGASDDLPLTLRYTGARFESPLVRTMLGKGAPPRLAAFFRDSDLRGRFDLDAVLAPRADGGWDATGSVRPTTMRARFDDVEIDFPSVEGVIEFSPRQGRMRGVVLRAPAWTAKAEGGWLLADDGGASIEAETSLESSGLPPDLVALAPGALRAALADLRVRAVGPVQVERARVGLTTGADGALRALGVEGRARFASLGMQAGVTVEDASGEVEFVVQRDAPESGVTFELLGVFDSVRAGGLGLTGARARIMGLADGTVLVPHLAASCHGGRVAGEVEISGPAPGGRRYEATITASNVRFASMLRDLGRTSAAPGDDGAGEADEPDGSRGVLDANLSLAGLLNDPSSRRGRGTGVVQGGRVVNMPLLVPLVRVSNLQIPIGERVDYAGAEFFVLGEYVNFESLTASSRSVEVFGFGTVRLPGMELDLRFRPKARTRIPMVTGLLEGIRNELVTVRAEGTLSAPELKVSTLAGTTRFIGQLFGEGPDEQERRLRRIEERATPARDLRRSLDEVRAE
ncbi:MAG: hypothetical protein SFY69_07980 [Planctomycetota bacterium]|nr:hypothetical protein [Planctomycetota bacterium]